MNRIDELCDLFEAAWKRNEPLTIEELACQANEEIQNDLIGQLVEIDVWWRRRKGLLRSTEDYRRRFPDSKIDWKKINPVFAEGDVVDEFHFLAQIGEGMGGCVYLALQVDLRRLVAVKLIHRETSEARLLSKLEHPGIVQIYDVKRSRSYDVSFLYMQYVPGGDLTSLISAVAGTSREQRTGSLLRQTVAEKPAEHNTYRKLSDQQATTGPFNSADWSIVVSWMGACLADALACAHPVVIHRDIKPANILLNTDGRPMLADFSLGTDRDAREESIRLSTAGTVDYMSPEQLRSVAEDRVDCEVQSSTDIFSLGLVLGELLTGSRPQVQQANHTDIRDYAGELLELRKTGSYPEGNSCLHKVLRNCLSYRPEDRPNAAELTRQLIVSGDPDAAVLAETSTGWQALLRKNPRTALILCGLIPNIAVVMINNQHNKHFVSELMHSDVWIRNWRGLIVFFFVTATTVMQLHSETLIKGLKSLECDPQDDAVDRAIGRGLEKGRFDAIGIFCIWCVAGLVFPLWNELTSTGLSGSDYAYFFSAEVIHGLVAGSLSGLCIIALVLRCFLPGLCLRRPDAIEAGDLNRIRDQARQMVVILVIAALSGIIRFVGFDHDRPDIALLITGFGLCSYLGGLLLQRRIAHWIRALSVIISPTKPSLETFWHR